MKELSQKDKLLALLSDKEPHSTVEILHVVYGGEHLGLARVGARIYDLKAEGHKISGWDDPLSPTIHWYQLDRTALGSAVVAAVEKPAEKKLKIIYEPELRDGRWVAVPKEVEV